VKWRLDIWQTEVLDDATVEMLRRKSPTERIQMTMEANRLVRLRLTTHFRSLHPDWNEERIETKAGRTLLAESADTPAERRRLAELLKAAYRRGKS
jgi:hypothetical protein